MQLKSYLTFAALALLANASAHADTYSCDVTVASVSFGRYERTSTLTGSGTVYVTCTLTSGTGQAGVPYQLSLTPGQSGSYAARTLTTGATDSLVYNLYTDSSYSTVWGDGSGGSTVVTGTLTGTSVSQTHTIFGRIPSGQNTRKGSFSDPTVQAIISF